MKGDIISHVLTGNGQRLTERTREALVTLVEVAYAAAQRGLLPDESHYPKRKNRMNQRIKNKLAKACARKSLASLLQSHKPEDVAYTLSILGTWGHPIKPAPTAEQLALAARLDASNERRGFGSFNGRFA